MHMDHIKKIVLIVLLNITSLLVGWSGHVVPLTFDKKTKQWLVLLLHNPNTGLWEDFWNNPRPEEERADQTATRALNELTNGIYDINLKGSSWFNNNDKILHFVTVDYIPANTLRENGCNTYADNFFWLPLSTLLTTQTATLEHNGKQAAISVHTKHAIKTFAQQFLTTLDAHYETTSQENSTTPPVAQYEITPELIKLVLKYKKIILDGKYNVLSPEEKNKILNALPTAIYEVLNNHLQAKLTNSGMSETIKDAIIKRYIIEEIINRMQTCTIGKAFNYTSMINDIDQLNICNEEQRKEFMLKLSKKYGSKYTHKFSTMSAKNMLECTTI